MAQIISEVKNVTNITRLRQVTGKSFEIGLGQVPLSTS